MAFPDSDTMANRWPSSEKTGEMDTILSVARLKAEGNLKGVIAVGCLAQRYGEQLADQIPELDGVFGLSDYSGVPAVVRRIVNGSDRRWVATKAGIQRRRLICDVRPRE